MINIKQILVTNARSIFKTSGYLREKVVHNPFFGVSAFSIGIKQALKAPGNDWKRDLNIPNVRIWNQCWHNKRRGYGWLQWLYNNNLFSVKRNSMEDMQC